MRAGEREQGKKQKLPVLLCRELGKIAVCYMELAICLQLLLVC
jgi:hypothetical protein